MSQRTPYCLKLMLLVGTLLAITCFGQPPSFEAGVTNVRIDTLVTQKGRIVSGLEQRDFLIRDEGEPRSTVAFAREPLPLDVVLVCQFVHIPPGGVKEQQTRFQYFSQMYMNSAARALQGLRSEDRVAVISFGLDPQIEQPLTSDQAAITAALRRIGTRSGPTVSGAHNMAIEWALRLLAEQRKKEQAKQQAKGDGGDSLRRSVILTVSVRGDNFPAWFNDEPTIYRLWEENTALSAIITPLVSPEVNVISTGREPDAWNYRLYNMAHIAGETGGSVVYVPTDDFPDLLGNVRSGYSLWFRPPEADDTVTLGARREITVELTEEAKKRHPGAEIQARKGYVVR